ncbi:MAG: pirin family protein [Desulfovibrio sp.]|jgi:redox-sensitive bicupin YhaK (pirin superfamily)|nr:pirin family protein [Desulfovibrio sp.]
MLNYIDSKKMGRSDLGWLNSHFHFSFAEYYNPENMHFGVLRVVNDDMVQPGAGFDTHPHRDMEIISYVIDGELTHADSMGNKHTLTRGQVQYMSAGTGVLHSEYNHGDKLLRFLQIWILPDRNGLKPNYGDFRFKIEDRENRWLPIATGVSNTDSKAPVRINQDINIYAAIITNGGILDFTVASGRQAYMIMIEGSADISGIRVGMRDALEIIEDTVTIKAEDKTHILVIEMENAGNGL